MGKKLIQLLSAIGLIIAAVACHLAAAFALTFPYSAINVLIVITSLHILYRQKGSVVWFAFFSFFAIELYSAQPFGLQLLAGTMQTLFVYWLSSYLFTNRSWYAAIALAGAGQVIYRSIYTVSLLGFHIFIERLQLPPLKSLSSLYTTELVMTCLGAALVFFLLGFFVKKKHSSTRAQYV